MGQLELERDFPDDETSQQRRLRRVRRSVEEAVSENQSLLPLAGAIIGVLLALVLGRIGQDPDPETWAITADAARSGLLGAISILAAGLSIVLALVTVTVQNVVSRFSLRMLRIYLRDPRDKAVIALFAMAAAFILAHLFQLRALPADTLAPVGGIMMGVFLLSFGGAMMIWYVSSLTNWFLVDRAVGRVGRLILHAARRVARDRRDDVPVAELSFERPSDAVSVPAPRSGYLTDVDTQGLLDLALRYDAAFAIDRGTGQSVVQGEPVGWIIPGQGGAGGLPAPDRIADMIGVSEMLEMDRAPWYGVVVLVDIAIMALSPAVNDPNTAVQVIESMARLFPELARVRLAPFGRSDAEGRQRVAVRSLTLGDYVEMATAQIVLYGGGDPAVIRALQHLVRVLERMDLAARDREAVDTLASRVQGLATEMLDAGGQTVPQAST